MILLLTILESTSFASWRTSWEQIPCSKQAPLECSCSWLRSTGWLVELSNLPPSETLLFSLKDCSAIEWMIFFTTSKKMKLLKIWWRRNMYKNTKWERRHCYLVSILFCHSTMHHLKSLPNFSLCFYSKLYFIISNQLLGYPQDHKCYKIQRKLLFWSSP